MRRFLSSSNGTVELVVVVELEVEVVLLLLVVVAEVVLSLSEKRSTLGSTEENVWKPLLLALPFEHEHGTEGEQLQRRRFRHCECVGRVSSALELDVVAVVR
jgi:hypothetical protein